MPAKPKTSEYESSGSSGAALESAGFDSPQSLLGFAEQRPAAGNLLDFYGALPKPCTAGSSVRFRQSAQRQTGKPTRFAAFAHNGRAGCNLPSAGSNCYNAPKPAQSAVSGSAAHNGRAGCNLPSAGSNCYNAPKPAQSAVSGSAAHNGRAGCNLPSAGSNCYMKRGEQTLRTVYFGRFDRTLGGAACISAARLPASRAGFAIW